VWGFARFISSILSCSVCGRRSVVENCGKESIDESEISIHSSPTSGYVYFERKSVVCMHRKDFNAVGHCLLCAFYGWMFYLGGSDCKYRESADKLRKSKILIICQKTTFRVLCSKILLKPSGILLFSRNSEKRFCIMYYAIIRLKIKQIEWAFF